MIQQISRSHVENYLISTIFLSGGGFEGMDLYETIIVSISENQKDNLLDGFRKISNKLDDAIVDHSNAIKIANHILLRSTAK